MQILQNMDPDKMVIILPSALVAMYLIISLQKHLCSRDNPHIGLILPAICFAAATVLSVRPLIITDAGEYDGLVLLCLRMWLTFNIATLVFLFPYYMRVRTMRAAKAAGKELIANSADSADTADGSVTDINEPEQH